MPIKDASSFKKHPVLIKNGIEKTFIAYMAWFWVGNESRNYVNKARVAEVGSWLQSWNIPSIVIDLEYVEGDSLSIVWDLARDDKRPYGIALWLEFIAALRTTYKGQIGMYGGHADWTDYFQFILNKHSQPEIDAKFARFDKWEQELQPLCRAVDILYPSMYGAFADYTYPDSPKKGYAAVMSYESYKDIWLQSCEQVAKALEYYHDKPIEFFVTHNDYGKPYPMDAFDFSLKAISYMGYPINVWGADWPAYNVTGFTDLEVGTILGNDDRL